MKITTLLAIILITIGIVAFGYQGIISTTRENVIDFGLMKMMTEKTITLPLLPIVGSVPLVSGIVLLVMRRKKTEQ